MRKILYIKTEKVVLMLYKYQMHESALSPRGEIWTVPFLQGQGQVKWDS